MTPLFAQESQEVAATLQHYVHVFQMDNVMVVMHLTTLNEIGKVTGKPGSVAAASQSWFDFYDLKYHEEIWIPKRSEYTPEILLGMKRNSSLSDGEWIIQDQKNSIVHELLHFVWKMIPEESAVGMIADAIIEDD